MRQVPCGEQVCSDLFVGRAYSCGCEGVCVGDVEEEASCILVGLICFEVLRLVQLADLRG